MLLKCLSWHITCSSVVEICFYQWPMVLISAKLWLH